MTYRNLTEARTAFQSDRGRLEKLGIYLDGVKAYLPPSFRDEDEGYRMALDAQPGLQTDPNSGIPWFLTNYVDPENIRINFAPLEGAAIYGEKRMGDWTTTTAMFTIIESTGRVASYGDSSNNGESNANTNFPLRQNYLYQTIVQYGELALARAGEARINWVAELSASADFNIRQYENFSYFFGISGLENYGGLNDPNLPPSLTPATKAYGGTAWFSGSTLMATPNEIYNDILAVYTYVVTSNKGNVTDKTKMVLALSPQSNTGFKAANSFGVSAAKLVAENLPSIEVMTASQLGVQSATNTQGIAAGNLMQLHAVEIKAQKVVTSAYSEKLRSHPIIREMSAFRQKRTAGTFGTVVRVPVGFGSMIGI